MLDYKITQIPVYTDRPPRHVVLYNEYNKLNSGYHKFLEEHAIVLELIKAEHNTLAGAVDSLTEGTVPDNSVTTSKLTDDSVTTLKIKDKAVTNDKLTGGIHSSKLKQPSITDLYKYMAVTGFTSDLYYNFNKVRATTEVHTAYRADADHKYYYHYIELNNTVLIPLAGFNKLLITKNLFKGYSTYDKIEANASTYLEENSIDTFNIGSNYLLDDTSFLNCAELSVRFTYSGVEYIINPTQYGDSNIYKDNTLFFNSGGLDSNYKEGPNTYCLKVNDEGILCLELKFNIEIFAGRTNYLSGDIDGGVPHVSASNVTANVLLKAYPILPLY